MRNPDQRSGPKIRIFGLSGHRDVESKIFWTNFVEIIEVWNILKQKILFDEGFFKNANSTPGLQRIIKYLFLEYKIRKILL